MLTNASFLNRTRDYVPHEVKDALVRLGGLLPMNIFLRQEIDRMQKILSLGKFQVNTLIALYATPDCVINSS